MKQVLFALIATLSFFAGAKAQSNDRSEEAEIIIKMDGSSTSYKFSSVKDFEQHSEQAIDTVAAFSENGKGGDCSVTITMSVSVTINANAGVAGGAITTTVTGSVTASCATIKAAALRLRAQLIAIASGQ